MNFNPSLQFGFARPVPVILQTEASECALACVAMLVGFHGLDSDLWSLRQNHATSMRGTSLDQLGRIASALGFATRAVRLELNELGQLQLPCILHWDLNHFVVLTAVRSNEVWLHDPATGRRRMRLSEVSEHFTGVALELSPAASFKPRRERQQYDVRDLMGRVRGLWQALGQIVLLAAALEVLAMVAPLMNQWAVDQAIVAADRTLLTTLAVGFALLLLAQVSISSFRGWVVTMTATGLNTQWLMNLYKHMLSLPVAFFERRHVGDVLSRFNSLNTIQNTLTISFAEGLIDGLMSIGTLVAMLVYSPMLSLVSISAVVCYLLLRVLLYGGLRLSNEREIVFSARQQSLFIETLRGIQSIKHFNHQNERVARWYNGLVQQKNATLRTQRLMLIFRTANQALFGADAILVLYLGCGLVLDGGFTVGMLFAFMAYKAQFVVRSASLFDKVFELRLMQLHAARMADIALAEPDVQPDMSGVDGSTLEPVIEFRHVSFRYSKSDPPVIRDLSLRIELGESVSIIGPSGSGKSTLLKLLLRALRPSAGEILIGGVPLQQISASNYHHLVGAVLQGDQLFAGSIAQNITFFASQFDPEALHACARAASIHDEIRALPMGYETQIGEMGTALSEGQKQRVLIARALFRRPKILLLDEATSNLDIQNERLITAQLGDFCCTRIVVAHRKETIQSTSRQVRLAAINRPPAVEA